jgi:Cobalamin-independent synthase, N-terminal domain
LDLQSQKIRHVSHRPELVARAHHLGVSKHSHQTFHIISYHWKKLIIMKVVSSSTLGFPRMGPRRELKFALEKYWKTGDLASEEDLLATAFAVEKKAWALQGSKVEKVTVGDYYLYDGALTWTEYLGIIPTRFQGLEPGLKRMFAMARGSDGATALSKSV